MQQEVFFIHHHSMIIVDLLNKFEWSEKKNVEFLVKNKQFLQFDLSGTTFSMPVKMKIFIDHRKFSKKQL